MKKSYGQRGAWEQHLPGAVVPVAAPAPRARRRPHALRPSRNDYLAQLLATVAAAKRLDDAIPERQEFPMLAVPKPRMSVRDQFASRPCVQRCRAFGDELRLRGAKLPMNYRVGFHFPMPASWPESIKAQMEGKPTLTRPDGSNLIKAVEDHLVPNDETLFKGSFEKFWSRTPRIVIAKGASGAKS